VGSHDEMHVLAREVIEQNPDASTGERARLFVDRAETLASHGSERASAMLESFAHEGARRYVNMVAKELRGELTVTHNGDPPTKIKTPMRQSTPVLNPDGTKTGRYVQGRLWPDYTWEKYLALVEEHRGRVERQGAEYERMQFVAALYAKYPQTRTPGEACFLEGIDPADMKIAI
jgi:hypothetical protein